MSFENSYSLILQYSGEFLFLLKNILSFYIHIFKVKNILIMCYRCCMAVVNPCCEMFFVLAYSTDKTLLFNCPLEITIYIMYSYILFYLKVCFE